MPKDAMLPNVLLHQLMSGCITWLIDLSMSNQAPFKTNTAIHPGSLVLALLLVYKGSKSENLKMKVIEILGIGPCPTDKTIEFVLEVFKPFMINPFNGLEPLCSGDYGSIEGIVMAPNASDEYLTEVEKVLGLMQVKISKDYDAETAHKFVKARTDGRIDKSFNATLPFDATVNVLISIASKFANQWKYKPSQKRIMFRGKEMPGMQFENVTAAYETADVRVAAVPFSVNNSNLMATEQVYGFFVMGCGSADVLVACEKAMNARRTIGVNMDVHVPTFKVQTELDLKKRVGACVPLTNIAEGCTLGVLQQFVQLECNERGASCVTATTMVAVTRGGPPKKRVLRFNGPFYFVIGKFDQRIDLVIPLAVALITDPSSTMVSKSDMQVYMPECDVPLPPPLADVTLPAPSGDVTLPAPSGDVIDVNSSNSLPRRLQRVEQFVYGKDRTSMLCLKDRVFDLFEALFGTRHSESFNSRGLEGMVKEIELGLQ